MLSYLRPCSLTSVSAEYLPASMQVVYTRGALLWQQLTSPGQLKPTGRLSYKSKQKVPLPDTLISFPFIAVYVMLRCVALAPGQV